MANLNTEKSTKVLRLSQVIEMTGVARSTIYKWIQNGDFPRPIKLSVRRVGWLERDVLDWIQSRPESCGPTWQQNSRTSRQHVSETSQPGAKHALPNPYTNSNSDVEDAA